MTIMRKGLAQKRRSERSQLAEDVVACGRWDAASLGMLAGLICERAVEEGGDSIPSCGALFARQVFEKFGARDARVAGLFRTLLGQAVIAEFRAYWQVVSASSLHDFVDVDAYDFGGCRTCIPASRTFLHARNPLLTVLPCITSLALSRSRLSSVTSLR